jgi:2'-5' RNA ligase
VRSKLPQAAWVKPESQHLTFAFLGEQDESIIATLDPRLRHELEAMKPFEARLCGAGFFPNPRLARVGWVGVSPAERFSETAAAVRRAVREAGVELDRADFKPHLTLVRIRNSWPPACLETFRSALADFASTPFRVDAVTVYSSRLHPNGAIHTPVREFALS